MDSIQATQLVRRRLEDVPTLRGTVVEANDTTPLERLGMTSFDAVDVLLAIEEELHLEFDASAVTADSLASIERLAELVVSQVAATSRE